MWEIVKKNNSFLVKEFGRSHAGVRFSKEPSNLLNLHSYKQSGLANKKTVIIQSSKDQSVLLATTTTRKHLIVNCMIAYDSFQLYKVNCNQRMQGIGNRVRKT
ncbi:putative ribosomal protein L28e [Rosa chinensis]|uniref:Putative ribosomal protein L28e n=2 Tax=Rosa chinensis TaxID=74649 RepID=A0A2P6S9I7_ROSCH|nr:putative ribosomal protein L28e [Rosa chinensis]PRQ55360.1 putative ribosomal protein L28e [Rosa chinensis]